MKKYSRLYLIAVILITSTILLSLNHVSAYIPEGKIIINETPNTTETYANDSIAITLTVKNYKNFTLTNITLSLNLTESENSDNVKFTSCEFAELTGDNITINNTVTTTTKYGGAAVNVTYLFMSQKYLTLNVSQLINGSKFLFTFSITSTEEVQYILPRVKMTYYDNWGDKQSTQTERNIQINFKPIEQWPDYLPRWNEAKLTIKLGWAIVIFGLLPIFVPIAVTYLFTLKIK